MEKGEKIDEASVLDECFIFRDMFCIIVTYEHSLIQPHEDYKGHIALISFINIS